ncbi:MAG: hypothetical protein HYW77_03150 [Parcubacteria group bacterium]|nr:hypothetical protein [Parcubacteria group bacterium]
MGKNSRKIVAVILFVVVAVAVSYFVFVKKQVENGQLSVFIPQPTNNKEEESNGLKTFTFDNFHGSADISDKFKFQYPAGWFNESQYFSPAKIQFYNQFTVKAPIFFDLVLAEIFHLTELQYQIDNSKRRSPDSTGQIDGREFKRYDLIDYGSYGGDSAGQVKIFVGPKVKIDGADYVLIFHWEEKPLAEYVPGNSVDVFDNMLLTLKFFN